MEPATQSPDIEILLVNRWVLAVAGENEEHVFDFRVQLKQSGLDLIQLVLVFDLAGNFGQFDVIVEHFFQQLRRVKLERAED